MRIMDYTAADIYGASQASVADINLLPYNNAGTVATEDFEQVSCSFVGECPDGISRNTCSWRRYLYTICMGGTDSN